MFGGENIRSSIDKFIWPNKLIALYLGLWPLSPNTHVALHYFNHFRAVCTLVFTPTIFIPQIFEIINHWGDIEIVTEIGCIAIFLFLVFFKQCYVVAQHVRLESTYWLLRDLWKVSRTREESRLHRSILRRRRGYLRLLRRGAALYAWKINEHRANGSDYERHLPLGSGYWFDPSPTPIFEIIFTYQAIAFYSAGKSAVGIDTTMAAIVMHVVGQFRLISARLKDIGITLRDDEDPRKKFDAWKEIENCVKHHERILRIAAEINSLLGPLIFGQVTITALKIGLSGHTVMNGGSQGLQLVKFSFLLASGLVQLTIYCWPGEVLIKESTGVAETICYEMPWFTLSYKQQRDLCMIIVRSQRESQITAMGLRVMSLQRITEVFNAAASYMALLKSMNEKQPTPEM